MAIALPTAPELEEVFRLKHGSPTNVGRLLRRRLRAGYFLPADTYEALVRKLVFDGCTWIDIGGGHSLFPENPALARELTARCSLVVGVDPSDNIAENVFVHEQAQCLIEDYQTNKRFDLATLRMVAEHVTDPQKLAKAISRLLRPRGLLVILTVNLFAPVSLLSACTPFALHHRVKATFWRETAERDTFPTVYKMNTRNALRKVFEAHRFKEILFAYLDDLSILGSFRSLSRLELAAWGLFRRLQIRYPENCLLSVFAKDSTGTSFASP